ncbi:MAG: hypothetical protein GY804_08630 [Alphaproteobacteria bacterium]|nr:hypothetical protein [Alphaproteobacteria bacterium]
MLFTDEQLIINDICNALVQAKGVLVLSDDEPLSVGSLYHMDQIGLTSFIGEELASKFKNDPNKYLPDVKTMISMSSTKAIGRINRWMTKRWQGLKKQHEKTDSWIVDQIAKNKATSVKLSKTKKEDLGDIKDQLEKISSPIINSSIFKSRLNSYKKAGDILLPKDSEMIYFPKCFSKNIKTINVHTKALSTGKRRPVEVTALMRIAWEPTIWPVKSYKDLKWDFDDIRAVIDLFGKDLSIKTNFINTMEQRCGKVGTSIKMSDKNVVDKVKAVKTWGELYINYANFLLKNKRELWLTVETLRGSINKLVRK